MPTTVLELVLPQGHQLELTQAELELAQENHAQIW